MKKYFLIFGLIICLIVPCAFAENETVNERLIRVEESIKSLDKRVDETNVKIDLLRQDMNKRFDNQQVFNYFILGGIFTMLTLISTLIIFIIWDRRSSLQPLWNEIDQMKRELKEKFILIYDHLELDKKGIQRFKTA
ncbi:conserved hypothetical protein, membrane [Candidatus Magnetomorum sp. HK-1]|nr:conserved hypothetical protein, membrane [Candidatus Magnetomorum sp. HK-1]